MDKEGLTPREADAVLNRESGVLGLSGISNDFRTLWPEADRGNADAALAIDVFCHSARKFIGAYAAVLDGLDSLVFTGGLGERDPRVRHRICASLGHLGVRLDEGRNQAPGPLPADLSGEGGSVPALVIPTQEELAIARQAFAGLQRPGLLQTEPNPEKMFG
jgi:acetate kinase